jgi:hypothetical protein
MVVEENVFANGGTKSCFLVVAECANIVHGDQDGGGRIRRRPGSGKIQLLSNVAGGG